MEKHKRTWRFISYGLAVLVIAGLSVALALAVERQNQYRTDLENMYEKSYYDTMYSVSLMENNLDKLSVSNDRMMQRNLLGDICREAERAESNLAQLNSQNESIDNIMKFLNQLGDYCSYLSRKVEGEDLSEEESQKMAEFSNKLSIIWTNLQSVQQELMQGGRLMGKFNSDLNYLNDAFANINNTEEQFPEMNYDGPFSDDVIKRKEPELLKGKQLVTAEQCKQKIATFFPDKTVNVRQLGESGDIIIPYYLFEVEVDNVKGTMQMSKQGGYLINFDSYKAIASPDLDEQQCIAIAEEFLANAGYTGMKQVWTSNFNSTLYVNFVYTQNDIIIYPDMIKVKVACDTGNIVGFEALNYIYNHKENRNLTEKSIDDVDYEPNRNFTLQESRIAVIPTEFNSEITVAEYVLQRDEDIFYVYVDIEDGKEFKILKQVDDNGRMLV